MLALAKWHSGKAHLLLTGGAHDDCGDVLILCTPGEGQLGHAAVQPLCHLLQIIYPPQIILRPLALTRLLPPQADMSRTAHSETQGPA